ncbi:MAG: flagellar hook-basal body complex protein FliE [bacterium]|nr:flagellar hook-basal body complex protein FliE [bacterium]
MPSIEPIRFDIKPIKSNGKEKEEVSFAEFLKESLEKVNQLQIEANNAVTAFSMGEDIDIHRVMIAIERANLSLSIVTEIRNRLLDAYHEIMRMVP